jgi:hypothetical protein
MAAPQLWMAEEDMLLEYAFKNIPGTLGEKIKEIQFRLYNSFGMKRSYGSVLYRLEKLKLWVPSSCRGMRKKKEDEKEMDSGRNTVSEGELR